MRDKVHTEEVKVRLTEGDKAFLENLSRERGIPPAVLARTFIKQSLTVAQFRVASVATNPSNGRPLEALRGTHEGNQSAA